MCTTLPLSFVAVICHSSPMLRGAMGSDGIICHSRSMLRGAMGSDGSCEEAFRMGRIFLPPPISPYRKGQGD